jgi:hypothetical protein
MLTWAPRVPSMNSKLANRGRESRPIPITSRWSIWSKYRALSRAAPTAISTSDPGIGGTYNSGSTRVIMTSATSTTSAGRTPSSMRKTSESNRAPSWRARTCVTTPERVTICPSGRARFVTTTSSNWIRPWTLSANEYVRGVASSVPRTLPAIAPSCPSLIAAFYTWSAIVPRMEAFRAD